MMIVKYEFAKGCPVIRAQAHVEKNFHMVDEHRQRAAMYFVCRGCEQRVHLSDEVVDMAMGNSLRVVCPGCKKPYLLKPCMDVSVAELVWEPKP